MYNLLAVADGTGIGSAITEVTGYATDVFSKITNDPVLVLFVAFPIVFGAIGIVKSLVGRM